MKKSTIPDNILKSCCIWIFLMEGLRERLTDIQWRVTQEGQTEAPYSSGLTKNKKKGEYFCIICGVCLFSSSSKFKDGCGWPAFYAASEERNIKKIVDETRGRTITEIKCGNCDAHLGHVYNTNRPPTGERFCINGCALNFIPS